MTMSLEISKFTTSLEGKISILIIQLITENHPLSSSLKPEGTLIFGFKKRLIGPNPRYPAIPSYPLDP